jgi:hypothetical protein
MVTLPINVFFLIGTLVNLYYITTFPRHYVSVALEDYQECYLFISFGSIWVECLKDSQGKPRKINER